MSEQLNEELANIAAAKEAGMYTATEAKAAAKEAKERDAGATAPKVKTEAKPKAKAGSVAVSATAFVAKSGANEGEDRARAGLRRVGVKGGTAITIFGRSVEEVEALATFLVGINRLDTIDRDQLRF